MPPNLAWFIRTTYRKVREYMDDPEHKAEFEKWIAEKKSQEQG